MSETVVSHTAKTLRSSTIHRDDVELSENIALLGESTAVYTIVLAEGLPPADARQLTALVEQRVSEMPFYSSVKTAGELEPWFKENAHFRHNRQLYFESLTRVSVSNKDISNRIGKALDLQNLIVFQVDRWPCDECLKPLRIRLKLRAVDLPTGLIIWTGLNDLEVDQTGDVSYDQLEQMSNELLTQFQKRFERKWHRKRLYNLSQLARK